MVRENLDFESENQSSSVDYWKSFDENEYWKKLSDIKSEKEKAKKEADLKRMRLMDELLGRKSTDALSDREIWKKIEWYLQEFKNNPDFVELWDINLLYKIKNAKDKLEEPLIYEAAAFLLANFEWWASPYHHLTGYENGWLWIKALLGNVHYNHFLEDKQNCINELSSVWKEKDKIQDALANCEMNYIVNNIKWSKWNFKYFWYHASEWKWSLPSQFADRLSSFSEWRFSKSSVKESYEKITHSDFDVTKRDFERFIKSARFPHALANLARMLSLSKNEEQKSECQKAFLICMLSGVLDFYGNTDMKKQVYLWGKTLWFLPGMLVKKTWHSEQVIALLDDFSKWDFSKHVKSAFYTKNLVKWGIDIWNLIDEINSWWSVDMMDKFEKYSKSDFLTKKFSFGSALWRLQKQVSNDSVDIDGASRS